MVSYTINADEKISDIINSLRIDNVKSRVFTVNLFNEKIRVELL